MVSFQACMEHPNNNSSVKEHLWALRYTCTESTRSCSVNRSQRWTAGAGGGLNLSFVPPDSFWITPIFFYDLKPGQRFRKRNVRKGLSFCGTLSLWSAEETGHWWVSLTPALCSDTHRVNTTAARVTSCTHCQCRHHRRTGQLYGYWREEAAQPCRKCCHWDWPHTVILAFKIK